MLDVYLNEFILAWDGEHVQVLVHACLHVFIHPCLSVVIVTYCWALGTWYVEIVVDGHSLYHSVNLSANAQQAHQTYRVLFTSQVMCVEYDDFLVPAKLSWKSIIQKSSDINRFLILPINSRVHNIKCDKSCVEATSILNIDITA